MGVSLADSSWRGRYPPEEDAPEAVAAWATSRQACDDPAHHEHDTQIEGSAGQRQALCGTDGQVAVGDAAPFSQPVGGDGFTAAYGEQVTRWARTVELTAPVELTAVVAPIGDEWKVIGTLDEAVAP